MIIELKLTAIKACIFASLFPFAFILLDKYKRIAIDIIALAVLLIGSVLLESRAMTVSVCLIFFFFRSKGYPILKSKYLLTGMFCLITILFFIKFNSLAGRWFIWQNILSNISTVPFRGFGYNSFKEIYAGWQSHYFQNHTEWSRLHWVADSPSFAFNELLHYYIEFGVIAVLIFVSLFVFNLKLLFNQSLGNERYFVLSNIVIFLFSIVSYPMHSIWILALLGLNHISIISIRYFRGKSILTISTSAIILLALSSLFYFKSKNAINKWEDARFIPFNYLEEKLTAYQNALGGLSRNQYFLNEYCQLLLSQQNLEFAIQLASKYRQFMNQYEYCMILAEAYKQQRNYEMTKKYFLKANSIIPNRFIPLAQLMELEIEYGYSEKAKEFANIIIQMPVKVPSPKVDFIKLRASEILQKASP